MTTRCKFSTLSLRGERSFVVDGDEASHRVVKGSPHVGIA